MLIKKKSWDRRVRPRLVWRNLTPLASRVVHGVTGALVVTIENVFRLARCPLGAKSPWRTADVAISFSNPGVD